ncbi:unnamed protein product, partial [Ectocarpus sp. 13 AM-2016]
NHLDPALLCPARTGRRRKERRERTTPGHVVAGCRRAVELSCPLAPSLDRGVCGCLRAAAAKMVRWSKLSGVDTKTLVDVLDPGHLQELREGESRQLK